MYWLPLVLLLSFGFGQAFKWAQRRGCSAPVVVTVNYLVLAGILAVYFGVRGQLPLDPRVWALGALTGAVFIVSMYVLTHALQVANVAVVLIAFRLAILVPILASVVLWAETVSATRWVGILLATLSLVLMTRGNAPSCRTTGGSLRLVFLIFLLQGASQTCLRAVHYAGLDPRMGQVLMVTALTAGLLGAAAVAVRGLRLDRRSVVMGAGIGVFNMAALLVALTALSQVKGTVFFPIQGCAVVLMDLLFAHWVWREPLARKALAGAFLGALAILLLL